MDNSLFYIKTNKKKTKQKQQQQQFNWKDTDKNKSIVAGETPE